MRTLAQDSRGTSRILGLHRGGRVVAALGIAVLLSMVLSAPSVAAPAGCAGKPGSPDRAALLQYCPKEPRSAPSGGAGGEAGFLPEKPASSSTGSDEKTQAAAKSDDPELPLTDYPSSDGINLLLLVVILIALGLAVAYGARRWRRGRPQAS
jgi:hypothetical protein